MSGGRQSWGAEVFDRVYAENPDPWGFRTSDYERDKYAASLAMLGDRHFASAFEIGCSIGVLTALLSQHCDRLLAVDLADAAVAEATRNCATLAHVQVEKMRIPAQWPRQEFDLVLFSEVLYFLSPADIARTAALTLQTLRPGGLVLLVDFTGPNDAPCTGDEAAEYFMRSAAPGLEIVSTRHAPRYRLDLLRRPEESAAALPG